MKILKSQNLEDVVFIDIETVRCQNFLEKGTPLYDSWEYKMRYSRESEKFEGSLEETFNEKSSLYAEFAKVVCITIGKIVDNKCLIKSYYGEDEKELLLSFSNTLEGLLSKNRNLKLCGHAIKGFDLPFLMRRFIINGLEIPSLLDTAHLKPWELTFVLDTLELWKGTGFYGASLLSISTALNLPSPKSDIDGSETSNIYYNGELNRIVDYCEKDVLTVANIFRKIRGEEVVEKGEIKNEVIKIPLLKKIYNTKKVSESDKQVLNEMLNDLTDEEKILSETILSVTLPK